MNFNDLSLQEKVDYSRENELSYYEELILFAHLETVYEALKEEVLVPVHFTYTEESVAEFQRRWLEETGQVWDTEDLLEMLGK